MADIIYPRDNPPPVVDRSNPKPIDKGTKKVAVVGNTAYDGLTNKERIQKVADVAGHVIGVVGEGNASGSKSN